MSDESKEIPEPVEDEYDYEGLASRLAELREQIATEKRMAELKCNCIGDGVGAMGRGWVHAVDCPAISDPEHLLEIDSLKMTIEEGSEIYFELVRSISGFVGERLKPCDPSCCPGHLGPAGRAFLRIGLEAYEELMKEQP